MTFHKEKLESKIPLTAIVIKAITELNKSKIPLTVDQCKVLFKECLEADVRHKNKIAVPLLCLFSRCNLMVTTRGLSQYKGKADGGSTDPGRQTFDPQLGNPYKKPPELWVTFGGIG